MEFKHAPIALFAYNRPQHLQQTVDALQRNHLAIESELYVFSDGAQNSSDLEKVEKIRNYLKTVDGFARITIAEQTKNLGLANSIISGVTEIVNRFGRIIVLEDDMVTSPYFLRYMNEALELYECEESVISIHGYVYPVKAKLPETFFLKGADCWGWATWKRGWDLFETDGRKLLNGLNSHNLKRRFDFNGTYEYTRMLRAQISGQNDSWAVRWYASALINERLTLYPGRSLVQNIGTDESGTHCLETNVYRTSVSAEPIYLEHIPPQEDLNTLKTFERYFRSIKSPFYERLLRKLKRR